MDKASWIPWLCLVVCLVLTIVPTGPRPRDALLAAADEGEEAAGRRPSRPAPPGKSEGQWKPDLPILVDRSGSMSAGPDVPPGAKSRYEQALAMLARQHEKVLKHFRPVWYEFAAKTRPVDGLAVLKTLRPAGQGTERTDLAGAIRYVAGRHGPRATVGILVLTDGVHNASSAPSLWASVARSGVPIFVVRVGAKADSAPAARNIGLLEVAAPVEAVHNRAATIKAVVRISGFPGRPVEVQLLEDGSEKPVAVERIMTPEPVDTGSVILKWTPKGVGPPAEGRAVSSAVRKLWVSVPVQKGESVTADNKAEIHVLVAEPKVRLLYIEGEMRPEYRFLKRLFDTDPSIEFASLIRIRDNRFWSYGRIGGKRLTRLPTTGADFKGVDVIILGDLDRSFLGPAGAAGRGRMKRVLDWVKAGGGLAMIGGRKSFGPGGYANTDIEKLLPVVVGDRRQPHETASFVPQLTALGEKHPIFAGIGGYFHGPGGRKPKADLPKLPELQGCAAVVKAKETAALLAVHPSRRNAAGPLPVLAVQQFGAGRTAAFTPDTTWRWYLPLRAKGAHSPCVRFWGQLVRWLAKVDAKTKAGKPTVLLRLDHPCIQVGQTVKMLVRVQDAGGRAVPAARVTCTVRRADGGGDPEVLPLAPQPGGKLFLDTYRPRKDGQYVIKAGVTDETDRPLGADELRLMVLPYSGEMARLAPDERILRTVARRTRSLYAELPALPKLIDQIIERKERTAPPPPRPDRATTRRASVPAAGLVGRRYVAAIILDNSMSMAATDGRASRFSRARAAANSLLWGEKTKPLRAALLVTNGGRAPQSLTGNLGNLRDEILKTRIVGGRADMSAHVQSAIRLLQADPEPTKAIFIFSDLQRAGFDSLVTAPGLRRAKDIRMVIVNTGTDEINNVGISHLEIEGQRVVSSYLRFTATLVNSSRTDRVVDVGLRVEGRTVAPLIRKTLRAASRKGPPSKATVQFRHRFGQAKELTGAVYIEQADHLEADNERRFHLDIGKQVEALVVAAPADAKSTLATSPVQMLLIALNPFADASVPWPVKAKRIAASRLAFVELSRKDVVFFCEVPSFTEAQARGIADFVRRGGTAVFFLGPGVDPDNYNQRFALPKAKDAGDTGRTPSLLPGKILQPVGVLGPEARARFVEKVKLPHPYLTGLYDAKGEAGYRSIRVQRYFRLLRSGRAEALATLDNGDDLLGVQSFGKGKVVLCATTASPRWSTLPLNPLFLPLVNRICIQARKEGVDSIYPVGAKVTIVPEGIGTKAAFVNITLASAPGGPGPPTRLRISDTGAGRGVVFTPWRAGTYTWKVMSDDPDKAAGGTFVVNPDPAESDLRGWDPGFLERAIRRAGVKHVYVGTSLRGVLPAPVRPDE